MDALLDGPFKAGEERGTLAAQVGAEYADRVQLNLRRQADDDPGTCRGMAVKVNGFVGHNLRLIVDQLDGDGFDEPTANHGMRALNAAVDDRDLDARAGRAAPGPLAIDVA